MKINSQELLLINKNRKFGESKPTDSKTEGTTDPSKSTSEATLKALDMQGKNNIAFQRLNQSLMQKVRQLPKVAVLALGMTMATAPVLVSSCVEQETHVEHHDNTAALIEAITKLISEPIVQNQEETNELLFKIIDLLGKNNGISKDNNELLTQVLKYLSMLDHNDADARAILNAILAKIEQSIDQNKEMGSATIALLEKIAANQDKIGNEHKELLIEIINKIDTLDESVQISIGNVIENMNNLGDGQKELLMEILKVINTNNVLSATNNNMLSIIINQLGQLDKNDKTSQALLNKIWAAIQQSIKENKEMDKQTQLLLQSILENIQNFNNDTKELLLELIDDLGNLNAEMAEAFSILLTKIDNLDSNVQAGFIEVIVNMDKLGEDQTALLKEILSAVKTSNKLGTENNKLLASILKQLGQLDKNDKASLEMLNKIWVALEKAIKENREMDKATIALLEKIAANQDKFAKEHKEQMSVLIDKVDNLDASVKTGIANVIENMNNLGDEQLDLLMEIIKVINTNNSLSAANNNMLAIIINQLGQLDKNDKVSHTLLNKIWAAIQESIKENQEMEQGTQLLLQSILENIQNFNNDTKTLLLQLIDDLGNLNADMADAFSAILNKMDKLDSNVQAGFIEVIAQMDKLGYDQTALLKEILNAVKTSNEIGTENSKLLASILKQLGELDQDDTQSLEVLNKIWVALEKAIQENKDMNKANQALLQSILENIQNFNNDNKTLLLSLIDKLSELDSNLANSFSILFNKIDNLGNGGQDLLNEILEQVVNGNTINSKNGEILADILKAMGDISISGGSGDNTQVLGLLKNIWATLQAHMEQDKAMDDKTHELLNEILANIKNFNNETTVLLKEILAKSADLGKEQLALLKVIIANQEKLQEQGKDATNKILEAINNNTEVAKGTHTLVIEILNKMDKLDQKGDKILEAIAKISVGGGNVDLSTIESMLADILAQEKANGDILASADAKASLVLVTLEGIKNTIKDGDQAIINKIQEVIDKMPESCKCDVKLEVIIKQLEKIIENTKNDESVDGDLSDLEDMFN